MSESAKVIQDENFSQIGEHKANEEYGMNSAMILGAANDRQHHHRLNYQPTNGETKFNYKLQYSSNV